MVQPDLKFKPACKHYITHTIYLVEQLGGGDKFYLL